MRLRFSGLANSISFLTDADEVSLGNNLVIKVFFSGVAVDTSVGCVEEETVAAEAAAGVFSVVVDVVLDNVSFGVEGTGSEGFRVDSPSPNPLPASRSISLPAASLESLSSFFSLVVVGFA